MIAIRMVVWMLMAGLLTSPWLRAAEPKPERGPRAQRDSSSRPSPTSSAQTSKAAAFAPIPAEHPMAAIWNDPALTQRLFGSYGFLSEAEPRLTAEEQTLYRERVVPLLRQEPQQALAEMRPLVKPEASALFDYTLATLHFQSGDLTNAVRHYEAALAKFPDFRRAQKNLALALMRDGQYEAAIPALSRTLELGGADGTILGLLGFAYLNQERFLSAEAAYKQAMLFAPDNVDYRLGIVKCQIALANYSAASALLNELLRQDPDRDTLWALQANLFVQQEKLPQAAINLEILRRLGKATPQHLALLGDLYLAQEAKDLALQVYLETVEKEGAESLTRSLRAADILTSRGAWAEAERVLAAIRSVAKQPMESADDLRLLTLESKVAMAQGRGETAIRVIEQIIERDPLDAEALLLAGDYYARHGAKEKAEFRYDAASKVEGFEAEAWVKQAQLLVQSQKYAQAVELLRKAQRLKPRDHVQRYLDKVEQVARNARPS